MDILKSLKQWNYFSDHFYPQTIISNDINVIIITKPLIILVLTL